MSKVTAAQLVAALEKTLAAASLIDPRAALASAGVEALSGLFIGGGEIKSLLDQVVNETTETAPEVAQAVSAFYTEGSDAVKASFAAHPGK